MTNTSRADAAAMVDHTLLKPEATPDDVAALAREAEELGAYSICVSPNMLPVETSVKVATVCGFPSGKHTSSVKAAEARESVERGADEIDMVIDVGAAKAGDFGAVKLDVRTVREAVPNAVLKVIIESAALTDEEIRSVCEAAVDAGADFVKTSTGFHPSGGASVHAVRLMRETVGPNVGVKASGGIRDAAAAQAMIDAGANRLGLSGTRAVLDGFDALDRPGGPERPGGAANPAADAGGY